MGFPSCSNMPHLEFAHPDPVETRVRLTVRAGAPLHFENVLGWVYRPDAGNGHLQVLAEGLGAALQNRFDVIVQRQSSTDLCTTIGQSDAAGKCCLSLSTFRYLFLRRIVQTRVINCRCRLGRNTNDDPFRPVRENVRLWMSEKQPTNHLLGSRDDRDG